MDPAAKIIRREGNKRYVHKSVASPGGETDGDFVIKEGPPYVLPEYMVIANKVYAREGFDPVNLLGELEMDTRSVLLFGKSAIIHKDYLTESTGDWNLVKRPFQLKDGFKVAGRFIKTIQPKPNHATLAHLYYDGKVHTWRNVADNLADFDSEELYKLIQAANFEFLKNDKLLTSAIFSKRSGNEKLIMLITAVLIY